MSDGITEAQMVIKRVSEYIHYHDTAGKNIVIYLYANII